jgi:hypothetical protein
MRASALGRVLLVLGVCCGGCALIGYDFDRYQPATDASSAGEAAIDAAPAMAGAVGEGPSAESNGGAAGTLDAVEPGSAGAAAVATADPIASTLGAGGAGDLPIFEQAGAGGMPGDLATCGAWSCVEQGAQCGSVVDACGDRQPCGACLWWFEECRQNRCLIIE